MLLISYLAFFIILDFFRISQVRSTFKRQILRIEDRRSLLTQTKESCHADFEALKVAEKKHTGRLTLMERIRSSSTQWCVKMKEEVTLMKKTMEVLYSTNTDTDTATTLFSATPTPTPASSSSSSSSSSHLAVGERFLSLKHQLESVEVAISDSLKTQVR